MMVTREGDLSIFEREEALLLQMRPSVDITF